MNIDQVLQQLWNLKTVFFALSIGVFVYVLRLIVEKIFPSLKKRIKTTDKAVYANKFAEWWNDIILYVFPIVLGAMIGAFAEKTFWPEFAPTRLGGIFYGAIVGWASGFVYKLAKKFMGGSEDELSASASASPVEPKKDTEPKEPAEEKPVEEPAEKADDK